MKKSIRNLLILGICLGCAGGCGKEGSETVVEKPIESAPKTRGEALDLDLDSDRGTMTITTPEGTFSYRTEEGSMRANSDSGSVVIGATVKIPENFPADVPIFPGFKVQAATSLGSEGTYSISGTVEASVDEVRQHYTGQGTALGWRQTMAMIQPQLLMLSYQKDGRMFQVAATEESGKSTVSITTASQ